MTIDQFCDLLRRNGVGGVDSYRKKLLDNEKDSLRLEDLTCEGEVALAFAKYGWAVTMRESPDVEARLSGAYLGIEVKHFRYKPSHDPVEDAATADGEFARVPHLSETEGREEAWDQMYRFAAKNAHQYASGEFNVIFFWCSTQAHWEPTLSTAAHIYDEALERETCDPAMRNLSAMMIKAVWGRCGSISLQPLRHANKPLTPELFEMLDVIREPWR
jgi:hypothetical protein